VNQRVHGPWKRVPFQIRFHACIYQRMVYFGLGVLVGWLQWH